MSNERPKIRYQTSSTARALSSLTHGSGPQALFDAGTSRELVGPFDRVESPWLAMQGVTPQEDDGCVVMKGKIAGQASRGNCA